MPEASLLYDIGTNNIEVRGVSFTFEELNILLEGPVKDILLDTSGRDQLIELLEGLATTDFGNNELQLVLEEDDIFEDWLVGEAIAEAFLTQENSCFYPWPTSRDLKNPNASPAGCDLTGFQRIGSEEVEDFRFSFGEVKTSYSQQSPPSVMTSLGRQLLDLRDNSDIKKGLAKYLALHCKGKAWEGNFKSAMTKYLQSEGTDITIFGLLVRDTVPNTTDLSGRIDALGTGCPIDTSITLYAIYLPLGVIQQLPDLMRQIISLEKNE